MPIAFDPLIPGTSGYSQRKRNMTEKIKDKQESLYRACKIEFHQKVKCQVLKLYGPIVNVGCIKFAHTKKTSQKNL